MGELVTASRVRAVSGLVSDSPPCDHAVYRTSCCVGILIVGRDGIADQGHVERNNGFRRWWSEVSGIEGIFRVKGTD